MKHFDLGEAHEALRAVRPLAERMVTHRREQLELERQLAGARQAVAGNGGGREGRRVGDLERRLGRVVEQVRLCVDEIHGHGAQVKDLDAGLVDFPVRHPEDGRTVLLCWRVGEEGIRHWHGVDEGFAGRKPLPF
jgi:hypothetical protein